MSGTHYGSCVLHIAPESGGGWAAVPWCSSGDIIDLDI